MINNIIQHPDDDILSQNGAEKKETRVCRLEACDEEGVGAHDGAHSGVHSGGQTGGHRDRDGGQTGFHLTSNDIERVRKLQRFKEKQRTAKVLRLRNVEVRRERGRAAIHSAVWPLIQAIGRICNQFEISPK